MLSSVLPNQYIPNFLKHRNSASNSNNETADSSALTASCCAGPAFGEAITGATEGSSSGGGAKNADGFGSVPTDSAIAGSVIPAAVSSEACILSLQNAEQNRLLQRALEESAKKLKTIEEPLGSTIEGDLLHYRIVDRAETAKFMKWTAGYQSAAVAGGIFLSNIPKTAVLAVPSLFGSAFNAYQHVVREQTKTKEAVENLEAIRPKLHDILFDANVAPAIETDHEKGIFFRSTLEESARATNTAHQSSEILPSHHIGTASYVVVDMNGSTLLKNVHIDLSNRRLTDEQGLFLGYASPETNDPRGPAIYANGRWISSDDVRKTKAYSLWKSHFEKEKGLRKKNAWCWKGFGFGAGTLAVYSSVRLSVGQVATATGHPISHVIKAIEYAMLAKGLTELVGGTYGVLGYNSTLNGHQFTPSVPMKETDPIRFIANFLKKNKLKEAKNSWQGLIEDKNLTALINHTFATFKELDESKAYREEVFNKMSSLDKYMHFVRSCAANAAPFIPVYTMFPHVCARLQMLGKVATVSRIGKSGESHLEDALDIPDKKITITKTDENKEFFEALDAKTARAMEIQHMREELSSSDGGVKTKNDEYYKVRMQHEDNSWSEWQIHKKNAPFYGQLEKYANFHQRFCDWIESEDGDRSMKKKVADGVANLLARRVLKTSWIEGKTVIGKIERDIFFSDAGKDEEISFFPDAQSELNVTEENDHELFSTLRNFTNSREETVEDGLKSGSKTVDQFIVKRSGVGYNIRAFNKTVAQSAPFKIGQDQKLLQENNINNILSTRLPNHNLKDDEAEGRRNDFIQASALESCCYGTSSGSEFLAGLAGLSKEKAKERSDFVRDAAMQYMLFSKLNLAEEDLSRDALSGTFLLKNRSENPRGDETRLETQIQEVHGSQVTEHIDNMSQDITSQRHLEPEEQYDAIMPVAALPSTSSFRFRA